MTQDFIMPDVVNSFKLSSAALRHARQISQSETYCKWRALLKRLEGYRREIDPFADQNANLDVLLRAMEEDILEELEKNDSLRHETAGFQLHLHLSRLWVLGAYEFLRKLHKKLRDENPPDSCLRKTENKGCGKETCAFCMIGHLKNEAAIVRMALAKGEEANSVKNPPLTKEMLGSGPIDFRVVS